MSEEARAPGGYVARREGPRTGYFRRGDGEALSGHGAMDPVAFARAAPRIASVQGRIAHPVVRAAGLDVVVKAYRRGGLLGGRRRALYPGVGRFLRELSLHERALRAGVPVVEVLGLVLERRGLGLVRAWQYTRWIPGSRDLWEAIRASPPEEEAAWVERAGSLARALAEAGIEHRDLSARNLLVAPEGLLVLDLDRARRLGGRSPEAGLPPLARLRRSLAKLAHLEGRAFDPGWEAALARGYAGREWDLVDRAVEALRAAAGREWLHRLAWRVR